jgi:site-specific recombinase XerD
MRFSGQFPKRHAAKYVYRTEGNRQSNEQENLGMGQRFIKWLDIQDYCQSTQTSYGRVATCLCRFIGPKTLRDVTPMDVGDFLTKDLPEKWNDDHANYRLGALRAFFDFLYLGGVVDSVAPRFFRARRGIKRYRKR